MQKRGSNWSNKLEDNSDRHFQKIFIGLCIIFIGLFVISEFNVVNKINIFTLEKSLPQKEIDQLEDTQAQYDPSLFDVSEIEENRDFWLENTKIENQLLLNSKEFNNLRLIQRNLEEFIQTDELIDVLLTKLTVKGLHILIYTDTIFKEGTADFQSNQSNVIENISERLVVNDVHNIFVVGHANDYRQEYTNISSNWDLSAVRAMQVKQILSDHMNDRETKFNVAARGDKEPYVKKLTEKNKHLNRRVEIILQPEIS